METALKKFGLPHETPENMASRVAELLTEGKVIARFDGPLEYGLRALGNRSILYQPTDPNLQGWLNEKLHRASYMPFAPMTMEPYASQCYENVDKAMEAGRFMTISYDTTDWMKEKCPGVVHIDGTVRPQILRRSDNPGMYGILEEYHRRTKIPSVLNTSFNMHEEPIVATAKDACKAFKQAGLDYLILGPFLVSQ
jgi:carbamoyltransferase